MNHHELLNFHSSARSYYESLCRVGSASALPAARRVENPGDAEPALQQLGERPRDRARHLVKQWEQAALAEAQPTEVADV